MGLCKQGQQFAIHAIPLTLQRMLSCAIVWQNMTLDYIGQMKPTSSLQNWGYASWSHTALCWMPSQTYRNV